MTRTVFALLLFLICVILAFGQHGTAPTGYYPMGYAGDTWTGEVSATGDTTREITLTYRKKDKVQTFTGVLQEGYKVQFRDGTQHELRLTEIPLGTRLRVYYMGKTRKVDGQKVKFHEIFRIDFLSSEKEKAR